MVSVLVFGAGGTVFKFGWEQFMCTFVFSCNTHINVVEISIPFTLVIRRHKKPPLNWNDQIFLPLPVLIQNQSSHYVGANTALFWFKYHKKQENVAKRTSPAHI